MRIGLGLGLSAGIFGGSSWTPSSPSAPLQGWYKSDVGFTAGGAWVDQSGKGNNFSSQGAGFAASGTLNGRQVITQNAGGWLLCSTFALGGAGAITMAGVFKVTGTGTAVLMVNYTDTAFDEHAFGYTGAGATPGFCHTAVANSTAGSTNLQGVWERLVLTDIAAGSQFLYVNNVQEATQATSGAIANSLQLRVGVSSSFVLAELLVYRGVLTSTDRANLDAYLKAAWAL